MKKLTIAFFDAGGGHRSAASALQNVIEQQRRPWKIELLNLQEVLDGLDPLRRMTGIRVQDYYNLMLKRGWTLGARQLLVLLHALVRAYHGPAVRMLQEYWRHNPADLIVSIAPNLNRALAESIRTTLPSSSFVTVLTDMADYPPHFWVERESQFIICGTDRAAEQAIALGHSEDRILRTSGMILNPGFYAPATADRVWGREHLGLHPDRLTGLVLFGGWGSPVVSKIVDRLSASTLDVQLILICGHNEHLARKLRRRHSRIPIFVEGFAREVPYYMQLSDFVIGKTGPGSISEAVAMKLPVIVECNRWTLPQERFNAEWVADNRVGIVLKGFGEIARAVELLADPAVLEQFRTNAERIQNRAVFEIPDLLQRILESGEEHSIGATSRPGLGLLG